MGSADKGDPGPIADGRPGPADNGSPGPVDNGSPGLVENGEPRPVGNGEPNPVGKEEPSPGVAPGPVGNGEPAPAGNWDAIPDDKGKPGPADNGEPGPVGDGPLGPVDVVPDCELPVEFGDPLFDGSDLLETVEDMAFAAAAAALPNGPNPPPSENPCGNASPFKAFRSDLVGDSGGLSWPVMASLSCEFSTLAYSVNCGTTV